MSHDEPDRSGAEEPDSTKQPDEDNQRRHTTRSARRSRNTRPSFSPGPTRNFQMKSSLPAFGKSRKREDSPSRT